MDHQVKSLPPLTSLLLLAGLFVTFAAYYPGLSGGFMFDDAWNITANPAIQIEELSAESLLQAAASGESGPLGRPASSASFAINHYFHGLNATAFKLTNLIIHLVNGFLVFIFCNILLRAICERSGQNITSATLSAVAALTAAIWLVQPINLTSVLYTVQRMTSLASLFILIALICYLLGRMRLMHSRNGTGLMFASVLVCMPVAVVFKEIGLLIPVYLLAIEASIFRFRTRFPADRRKVLFLFSAFLVLPAIALAAYIAVNPDFIIRSYNWRDFTLTERLLTETRVIWSYIQWILLPNASSLGLFHDDIVVSTSLFKPLSTFFSILGTALLLGTAWILHRTAPLVTLGILLFLGGHAMESTVIGLELAHEHRNYLPQLGLILPLVFYAAILTRQSRARLPVYLAAAFYFLFLSGTLFIRSETWSNEAAFSLAEVAHHPHSARANYQMGRLYAQYAGSTVDGTRNEDNFSNAERYFVASTDLDPSYTDGLFGLLILYSSNAEPVRQELVSDLEDRLQNRAFSANSVNQINNLVKCQIRQICSLTPDVVDAIFQAVLRNPSLKGRSLHITRGAIDRYKQHNHSY